MFKQNRIIFVTLFLGALTVALLPSKVYAACEDDGDYGETCTFEKKFQIEKKVRISGDSEWKDKVTGVKEGQIVEFRIIAKNIGELSADDMKMIDSLPGELEKTGGAGLTEEWNDFNDGDSKTFIIQARIKSTEFKRTDNFEKCVVNKAELRQNDNKQGSDTATVCYGEKKITELPKTGPISTELMSILGFASTGLGLALKKRK